MRPAFTFKTLLLFFCLALSFSCSKESIYREQIRGTIAALSCGLGVINVDGPSGTAGGTVWREYQNALTVKNSCVLVDMGLKKGDKIIFRIHEEDDTVEMGTPNCFKDGCTDEGPGNVIGVYDISKIVP